MKVTRRTLVALVTVLVLLAGLIGLHLAGAGSELKTVRVAMGYIPNVQFAPWYVAEAKGYYAKAGLKVEMDYSMDVDGLALLGQGKKEFAIGGGDMALIGRSQGLPIVDICTLYAKFPVSVVALQSKGIKSLPDLRGKRIGVPYYGTSYIALRAMLAKAKLTENDVQVAMIGYTQIPALLGDKIDAAVVFANNEPVQLKAQGQKIDEINSYDYFPLPGHGVITSDRLIKEDPALVRAFVRATKQAMVYTMRNPKTAFQLVAKAISLPAKDEAAQYQVMLASLKLWENAYTKLHGLGSSDPKVWEESQQFMLDNGFIKNKVQVAQLMTNAYLR
jgi:NitT/TauT family transport system substrate-binding protein